MKLFWLATFLHEVFSNETEVWIFTISFSPSQRSSSILLPLSFLCFVNRLGWMKSGAFYFDIFTPIHPPISRFGIRINLKLKPGSPSRNNKTLCLGMFYVSHWILPSLESVLSHTSGDHVSGLEKREICFEKSLRWLEELSWEKQERMLEKVRVENTFCFHFSSFCHVSHYL